MSGKGDSGRSARVRLDDLGGRLPRVAHELNAPLSLIVGSIENLERHLDVLIRYARATEARFSEDSALAERYRALGVSYAAGNAPRLVAVCEEGAQRLRHVLEQLKRYTGQPYAPQRREEVDAAETIRRAVGMASHGRTSLPVLELRCSDVPRVIADRDDLGQALTNLVANALDAVADRAHARVWIAARVDEAGGFVEVSVRDNGPGVPEANRRAIFEPFFTTKSRGAGLGLGLAIAREAMEAQGGSLSLVETGGAGAEFVLRVPAAGR